MAADRRRGGGFEDWAPSMGIWETCAGRARFILGEERVGILLGPEPFSGGQIDATVTFDYEPEDIEDDGDRPQARILFGYDPASRASYAAGIGGYRSLYVIEEFY